MTLFFRQLIPLQAPLKTMLQMSVVPLINSKNLIPVASVTMVMLFHHHGDHGCVCVCSDWTKRGVRIPLADGMDFIEEVVEYHNVSD